MDDKIELTSKLDEDSLIENTDSEMVLVSGTEMNVEEPVEIIEIGSKAGHLEESEGVCRGIGKKGNDKEEVAGDAYPQEDVNIEGNCEEDMKEEMGNDENPREKDSVQENTGEDPEEDVRNDENLKEEFNTEENDVEQVKNEDGRNEGKIETISVQKLRRLKKRSQMLKKRKIAMRRKVKNALVSTSKLAEDDRVGNVETEVMSLQMNQKNNIPAETGVVIESVKNGIVDDVDSNDAIPNQVKVNGVAVGDKEKKEHEIGKVRQEENTKEEMHIVGDTRNEAKAKQKLETNSNKKVIKSKKLSKKMENFLDGKNEVVVSNRENSESSKKKVTVKEKCMGMIFMCSSKTKKDCYHYQVLGLPASKRDLVFDINEGMKLFLFDIDLKLMYGIYEAAGPGGYNIEPKAFSSAFPSQVRFSIREDCLPLAEEKFKNIIKDNYYSKNKFDCQLNSRQVENLCELFRVAGKGSTSKLLLGRQQVEASSGGRMPPKRPPRGKKAKKTQREAPTFVDPDFKQPHKRRKAENERADAPRPVDCDSKWPRKIRKAETLRAEAFRHVGCERKGSRRNRKAESSRAEAPSLAERKSKRPGRSRKGKTHPFVDPNPTRLQRRPREETQNIVYGDSGHRGWEDERHQILSREHLYPNGAAAYRRVYESPLEHPPPRQPLHLPLASSLPSFDRDVFRRDRLQYHDLRPLDVGLRRRDEFEHRDSYTVPRHHDGFNRYGSYLASRGYISHLEPLSSAAQSSKYYPPSGTPASTYDLSPAPGPSYQPHPPVYRYYP